MKALMPLGTPMIELHQVSRMYRRGADEVHALERISLQITGGTFVALRGPIPPCRRRGTCPWKGAG
jgi:predicted ABC-type transport system involved in lysophospholipase L1 biosynthesis ATPase subunit